MVKVRSSIFTTLIAIHFVLQGSLSVHARPTPVNLSNLSDSLQWALALSNQNPDSALIITDKLQLQIDTLYQKNEAGEFYRIKGLICFYKVDYTQALNYFMKSQNCFLASGNRYGEAKAINNIAVLYSELNMPDKALALDSIVLKIRIEIKDTLNLSGSYNNIGNALKDLGHKKEALSNYHRAVRLANRYEKHDALSLYLYNVGGLYLSANQYDSAFYYFDWSLKTSIEQNDLQSQANVYRYFGEYYIKLNQYEKAITYLKKSLALAEQIKIVYEIESAAQFLHQAYQAMGDYKNAYISYKLFDQMRDSANNLETIQRITTIEKEAELRKMEVLRTLENEKNSIKTLMLINQQKAQRNLAIVVLMLISVIALVIYKNYRRKSINNLVLEQQKEEILAQKEESEAQADEIRSLNETKDKFLAIIAHDLRNPMSGIMQLSEMLKEEIKSPVNGKASDYVEHIHKSSTKAFNLLENLLQWAMVQVGKVVAQPVKLNLEKLIKENIELFESSTQNKNLLVTFNSMECAFVFADRQMINTVVRNLINNAVKFTNENGLIQITIMEADVNYIKVSIKDNGIGIKDGDLPILFDSGRSSKSVGNSHEKGNGLGLLLCKEFILRNGGTIWAESTFGSGSEFCFTLPKVMA